MKFSIKDFFIKCDQIPSYLRIWSHLLKKSLMDNFIFCAVVNFSGKSLYLWVTDSLYRSHSLIEVRDLLRLLTKFFRCSPFKRTLILIYASAVQ